MNENYTRQMQETSYLSGGNAAYLEDLYEAYLQDPQSLTSEWQNYFNNLLQNGQDIDHSQIRAYFSELAKQPVKAVNASLSTPEQAAKQIDVYKLINAYRRFGHFQAQLDPLKLTKPLPDNSLQLASYGLTNADLASTFLADNLSGMHAATLQDILTVLQKTYCSTIGFEYQHLINQEEIEWLRERIEKNAFQNTLAKENKKRLLQKLTEAEGLEKYLGAKYVGQTRFSLEGGDSLVPMIDELIQRFSHHQAKEIVIGMAHRGRLNVLVNIFGKSPIEIFQEFEGKHPHQSGSGDVKYHMGFSSDIETPHGLIHLALAFNPSHLEIINPVIEGSVLARQYRGNDFDHSQVIPVLIHGDAAIAGQGVVMETFSLAYTRGFSTGGTVHIVINNQIGYTVSNPHDARSSWYCTDVAKMIEMPIFHVNADDPEAVYFVTQLAADFRTRFKRDVMIDLVCYRRYGHNEGDEPSATQPLMYQVIKQHPTTRKLYADKLLAEKIVSDEEVNQLINSYRELLDKGQEIITKKNGENHARFSTDWTPYLNQQWTASAKTAVDKLTLQKLAKALETLPDGFVLQTQVSKMMDDRRKMTAGELPLNWGYAETLAYASLLNDGYSIRLVGEDCQRGTFAHRHAVLHDMKTDKTYVPLEQFKQKSARIDIIDSILSEEAVLGFEYGYATASPETLDIWEAQYGDFVNGAQVVIDQFISSGEQKWGRLCGLTLLLPHGYEGAGPEHSSARLERFLQLCAEHNMQVCIPSTPAQIFHLLRRQMIRPFRKPLIVITPKSLLRHKLAVSTLDELSNGEFQLLVPEVDAIKPAQTKRVILCSGKVYYDLLEQRRARQIEDIAIVRVEQLYPFPKARLTEELENYKKAKEVIWCQEEPKNQGAWYNIHHHLTACLGKNQSLTYVGRKASASPATGIKSVHAEQQKALIDEALSLTNS